MELKRQRAGLLRQENQATQLTKTPGNVPDATDLPQFSCALNCFLPDSWASVLTPVPQLLPMHGERMNV